MDQEIFPPCFSAIRFYRNWRDVNARCGNGNKAPTVCVDCLPSYQLKMKRQGRCSNPEMPFHFDEDGTIVGGLAPVRGRPTDETRAKMRASALARIQRQREVQAA